MEVYVVYEMLYGELIQECGDSANLIGVYKSKEEAIDTINKVYINSDINEGYVLDNEKNGMINDKYGIWRMFWNNQENWNCYYEIIIEKKEVK